MKKTILVFKIDHAVDLITNSSSELFVLEGSSKEMVSEMISSVYPSYLLEYSEPVSMKDLSLVDLETYINQKYMSYPYDNKSEYAILGIEPSKLYSNWDKVGEKYFYPQLSESGAALLREAIDPQNKMYFLFSLDENPDWDMQEKLMDIGERYHLG